MDNTTQISMKGLNNKTESKIKRTLYTVAITIIFMLAIQYVVKDLNENIVVQQQTRVITLENVIIAYAPETKSIIFLDRKTGDVEFALSDTVSLAVFNLKAGQINSDYSSKLTK